MTPDLILPYEGALPVFATPPSWCGRGSAVIGASTVGARLWLGEDGVIRADGQTVTIGEDVRLGSRSTVHIATDTHPAIVGDRVSVGRNAVVHACTVGSDVVIEDGAIVLDGAVVGDGVLIEAGSTVFPRSILEPGFAYAGSPAKRQRPITAEELAERAQRLREPEPIASTSVVSGGSDETDAAATAFVARTARLRGRITIGSDATILFSCALDASKGGPITIGAGTNLQDNTEIVTLGDGVVIGRDTTIAHNVRLGDCRIGARSLIGIGCVLAPGTIVADDVLLAGGATTEPGQLLEGGHLWGGRPARILGPLDANKRAMMAKIIEGYRAHGRYYGQAQRQEAAG